METMLKHLQAQSLLIRVVIPMKCNNNNVRYCYIKKVKLGYIIVCSKAQLEA